MASFLNFQTENLEVEGFSDKCIRFRVQTGSAGAYSRYKNNPIHQKICHFTTISEEIIL